MNDHPRRAPLFYGIYTICVIAGAGLVLVSRSLVRIAVDVEILNALLLPIVIGFLVALAWTTRPRPHHLRTGEHLAAVLALGVVALVGAGWLALTLSPG